MVRKVTGVRTTFIIDLASAAFGSCGGPSEAETIENAFFTTH